MRAFTAWSDSQLKKHLHRLEELEYLLVHHGGRGQSFVYELVFERQDDSGRPVLPGLIEVEKLAGYATTTQRSLGSNGEKSGPSRPQVAGVSGGGAGDESPMLARRNGDFSAESRKKSLLRAAKENPVVIVTAARPRDGARRRSTAQTREPTPPEGTPLAALLGRAPRLRCA